MADELNVKNNCVFCNQQVDSSDIFVMCKNCGDELNQNYENKDTIK